MPTQPDHQPLRVGSPTDLLAVVPHLLGFIPGHSLVIAGARGPQLRIEVTLRFDLPDPPDGQAAASIAAHAVSVLASQQFTTAVVIGYGPGPLVTPLADAIREAMTGTDLELRDVLRVEGDRYWSYLCASPLCCPPEGVPFDIDGHPASAAFTVASGQQILGSRDDLAATIAPVTGPIAEAMRRETIRAQRIAARLITRAATTGGPARPVIQHGLKAVQAAITTYRDGGAIELAGQFAWLVGGADQLAGPRRRLGPHGPRPRPRPPAALDRPDPPRPARIHRRPRQPARLHRLAKRQRRPGQPRPRPGPRRHTPATPWPSCSATPSTPERHHRWPSCR